MPHKIVTRSTRCIDKLVVTKDETKARAAWLLATLTIRRRVAFVLTIMDALDARKDLRVRVHGPLGQGDEFVGMLALREVKSNSVSVEIKKEKNETPQESQKSEVQAQLLIKQEEDTEPEQEDEEDGVLEREEPGPFCIQSWVQVQLDSASRLRSEQEDSNQPPKSVFAWKFGKAVLPVKRNGRM